MKAHIPAVCVDVTNQPGPRRPEGGAEEDRTPNLGIANAALSQLSYRPESGAAGTPLPTPENRWYGTVPPL